MGERLASLWYTHQELTLRILAVRLMIEHRRIPVICPVTTRHQPHPDGCKCLVVAIGRSKEFIHGTLRGGGLAKPDASTITDNPEVLDRRLQEIEDGITMLTDRAGGLAAMCGCTPDAFSYLRKELTVMPTTVEAFNVRSGNTHRRRGA